MSGKGKNKDKKKKKKKQAEAQTVPAPAPAAKATTTTPPSALPYDAAVPNPSRGTLGFCSHYCKSDGLVVSLDELKKKAMDTWTREELADWFAQVEGGDYASEAQLFSKIRGRAFAAYTLNTLKGIVNDAALAGAIYDSKERWLPGNTLCYFVFFNPCAMCSHWLAVSVFLDTYTHL